MYVYKHTLTLVHIWPWFALGVPPMLTAYFKPPCFVHRAQYRLLLSEGIGTKSGCC